MTRTELTQGMLQVAWLNRVSRLPVKDEKNMFAQRTQFQQQHSTATLDRSDRGKMHI